MGKLSFLLPRRVRFALYRRLIECNTAPPQSISFKLAETQEELEACFRLLHEAYVQAGFMHPHPSGLRATLFHALPTTTTLLAKHNDRVIGTVSLIRESSLGFPLQKVFNIDAIRKAGGNLAEVSALAIDRRFRGATGAVLFPLLKFMYEYATRCFDTRHLLIAVNPRHIEFYESILFFERLRQNPVEHYDFVNGAPAVGAHLDLQRAYEIYRRVYDKQEPTRNLFRYFTALRIPNIVFPEKRFYTTNDPVMTPALLDYFFNQRTQLFASLKPAERKQLHDIYDLPAYRECLPPVDTSDIDWQGERREHRRFSVSCPGEAIVGKMIFDERVPLRVLECSNTWLRAETAKAVPVGSQCSVSIELGAKEHATLLTQVVRKATHGTRVYLFRIQTIDATWQKFVNALNKASTHHELENASRFLEN